MAGNKETTDIKKEREEIRRYKRFIKNTLIVPLFFMGTLTMWKQQSNTLLRRIVIQDF
jgi:hypothetical protein